MRQKETGLQRVLHLASILLLAALFLFVLRRFGSLPEKIPGHYNAAGEVDRWGSRSELLTCPILSLVLFAVMFALERFPQIWNTGVEVTEENREFVYRTLRTMMAALELVFVLTFGALTVFQANAQPLPLLFLPIDLLLLFGTLAVFLIRLFRGAKKSKFPGGV